jgi:hypothetical protein
MTQKAFISDADAALASLVWSCVENDSALKKAIASREQIAFSTPRIVDFQGTKKLSIFLYSITQEATPPNTPPTGSVSKKAAETCFALRYLITPLTGNDKDDHELLERIIHSVLAKPRIGGAAEENNSELLVKVDSLSLDELSRLWAGLGAPLRLSVSLTVFVTALHHDSEALVTVGSVTPKTPAAEMEHVTQLYQAVLKTFTEQSNGWRSRNVVIKQWVFSNFKKNTGLTVEEMQIALNSLGGSLEQHGSSAQFIESLNLLAGYYEHLLGELKGLQKVSHKQKENLETVDAWIKEVKTLVETLAART